MTCARPSDAAVAAGSNLTPRAATNTTAGQGHKASEITRCGTPERTAIQLLTRLLATGVSATPPNLGVTPPARFPSASDRGYGQPGWPLIIQTILLYPSGAVWTDEASNVSSQDPSGAGQVDADHPSRNRKVQLGPTSCS
jgi:hypothetical protein